MHGSELRLFCAKAFPHSNYLCRASDIVAVGTILTSLVMTRCRTEIRTYHLPDDERMRYVLSHGRGLGMYGHAAQYLEREAAVVTSHIVSFKN